MIRAAHRKRTDFRGKWNIRTLGSPHYCIMDPLINAEMMHINFNHKKHMTGLWQRCHKLWQLKDLLLALDYDGK